MNLGDWGLLTRHEGSTGKEEDSNYTVSSIIGRLRTPGQSWRQDTRRQPKTTAGEVSVGSADGSGRNELRLSDA